MKNTLRKYYILFSVLSISALFYTAKAQPEIAIKDAKQLVEKTFLITDREIYCVDEDILFSAFNISSPALRDADWTNVLYVELVAPNGEAFVRRKLDYDQIGATGTLRIPNAMLTGNYYLRAYTRWMRDYSPYNYFYKIVKVINPNKAELLEPSGNDIINEAALKMALVNTDNLRLKTDRKTYKKREQVRLEISANTPEFADKYVVSVIPEGTETQLMPDLTDLQGFKFSSDFIPETRGLSISGKVVNDADSIRIPFTLVGLTIFKEHPENRIVLTNEKGQFFFDLSKIEGEYEIFISAKPKENQSPLILVDNDFSTQQLELPYVKMDLSDESMKIYESMMFNVQMHSLYQKPKVEDNRKSFSSDSSFYGTPDFVLKIADYIALANVRDYIYELVPQVGVRHDGQKTKLKVLGPYSELSFYDPLVLVDMVPIFDIDKVLVLQPDKIDRIEVVATPYVRGDIIFGGIISLFSKKGDLAGIDLPSAGRFITYNMLNSDAGPITRNHESNRVPDLRNCLYWNPELKLKGTEPTTALFNTGDSSGDFLIIVRGIDKKGNAKVTTTEITVE